MPPRRPKGPSRRRQTRRRRSLATGTDPGPPKPDRGPGFSRKLVVGLGNPGRRYAGTRHNVGFRIVERLAERHGLDFLEFEHESRVARGWIGVHPVVLLEPQTFMNRSGGPVAEAARQLPALDSSRDLVLVYDDVDLPFGRLRIRPEGGAGGHRGVGSVIEQLGHQEFPRLRFGIGRSERDTVAHVLEGFSAEEERALTAHIERAADALETLLEEGVGPAMNQFNPDPD